MRVFQACNRSCVMLALLVVLAKSPVVVPVVMEHTDPLTLAVLVCPYNLRVSALLFMYLINGGWTKR